MLVELLKSKKLLILLDNCEHVVEAAACLVNELLQACPWLHFLTTSREVLGAAGEITFHCPTLSLPDPHSLESLTALKQSEAVRLFVERAKTVSPGFELVEVNAAPVARICRRLDGVPLAIELAAARLRLLSIEQVAGRLDDLFHLLTGGLRTNLPRAPNPAGRHRLVIRSPQRAGAQAVAAPDHLRRNLELSKLPRKYVLIKKPGVPPAAGSCRGGMC